MDKLDEIRARCEAATPGPWAEKTNCHPQCNGEPWGWISGANGNITWGGNAGRTDAAFIAHAREDIPYLLAEIKRIQKHAENLRLDYVDLLARAEKAEKERDKANKCIYDAETYFNFGANKFAYRTIKQYTHDATKQKEGE